MMSTVVSQTPTVSVRFQNPQYTCATGLYCLDVELKSDTVGVELFGMNVRLFYDDAIFELAGFTNFQGGYAAVSPDPPVILQSGPGIGYTLFGFGESGTGIADFVNGAVQLVDNSQPEIILDTAVWSHIFTICFTIDDANPDSAMFCPPVVWDLEQDPLNGGFLSGDDGVVITVVHPDPNFSSLPALENVVQFNWEYIGNGAPPYGQPIDTVCISLACIPALTCPANITLGCGEPTSPEFTGTAVAADVCGANVTITFSDAIVPGLCSYSYTIERSWMALNTCNVADTCVQIISILDTEPPDILYCPPDTVISYLSDTSPGTTGFALATDMCDTSVLITYVDSFPQSSCPAINFIWRTWVAEDDCGLIATCQQYIQIADFGDICGQVMDDLGNPMGGIAIELHRDVNANGFIDTGDTIESTVLTDTLTGQYCFTDVRPCHYVVQEIQPADFGDLMDFDLTPDPDGQDSLDGPDNEIPVEIIPGELDATNLFIDIRCPTELPVIPPDTICENGTLVFQFGGYNLGTLLYSWDFGSGASPSTGLGLGPHSVSYVTTTENQSNGSVIHMTISKEGCPDHSGPVSVIEINPYPDATINTNPTPVCYYTNKLFITLQPPLSGATYSWTFGVGAVPASATGYGPHNVYYTTTGLKTAKLVIHPNEAGSQCPDSSSINFIIQNCPAQITGHVNSISGAPISAVNLRLFADTDTNGIPDSADAIRSVFSTTTGTYSMASLTPGNYVILQIQPDGWVTEHDEDFSEDEDIVLNLDPLDNLIPVTLLPLELDSSNVFTESPGPGTITGTVFHDYDADLVPDPGEGMGGVFIHLLADSNADGVADSSIPLDIAETDMDGHYTFDLVPIGHYVLAEVQPSGYISLQDFDASNDGDTVINGNTLNDTIPVTLSNGESDAHNYFIDAEECSLTVTNTTDDGYGSLRHALSCANDGDTIRFDPGLAGMTIAINSSVLSIQTDVVIQCEFTPRITIASQIDGLFEIQANADVEFRDCNIISGMSNGNTGAAFQILGVVMLHNTNVYRNPDFSSGQYLIRNEAGGQVKISGSCFLDMN